MPDDRVFLDTNALLEYDGRYDVIYISSISLLELENIKTSSRKDEEVKYKARKITRWLEDNENRYDTIICNSYHKKRLDYLGLDYTNDNLIAVCAEQLWQNDIIDIFITNDLCLKNIINKIFEIPVKKLDKNKKEYTGWKEITLDNGDMAKFYENQENEWDLLHNEYLIVKNKNGEAIDKYRWTNDGFESLFKRKLKTMLFGDIKPHDEYQECALDSLRNNDFTILTGMAGTAKTLFGLAYSTKLLNENKIDKLIIAHNPNPLGYAQKLGFLPGSANDKLLGGSLGSVLNSKLGDLVIESYINQGKIQLMPMCNIRGFEVGERDCVFVTEAQNMNPYLVKTLIQRCKEGCKIILEGDDNQVDDRFCSADNNGLRRAIEVFKGHNNFGCVKLMNVYRSEFAKIAEKM